MRLSLLTAATVMLATLSGCSTSPTVSSDHDVTTASGLSYSITREGTGAIAEPGMRVTIHESTALLDGTVVFSTWDLGRPLTFTLGANQVIDGVDECVTGMRVGERRAAIMPPSITQRSAYPDSFGPDDTLVYDILLVDVARD